MFFDRIGKSYHEIIGNNEIALHYLDKATNISIKRRDKGASALFDYISLTNI